MQYLLFFCSRVNSVIWYCNLVIKFVKHKLFFLEYSLMAELLKLGKKIRSIRGSRTQQEFARILEISQGSIAKYENGLAMPRASTLFQIAKLGEISVETLLKRADLACSSSKSTRPRISDGNSANGSTGNLENLIVSLKEISDLDYELGKLVANLVKAFLKTAKNPDLEKKRRDVAKKAIKTLDFPS